MGEPEDYILAVLEAMPPARPVPMRLMLGRLAWESLHLTLTPAQGPMRDSWWVYGVQVVLRDDFDWRAWQLIDSDGELLRAGTVE